MVSDILFGAVMGIGQSLSAKRDFEREIFKQDQEKAARMEELREEYRLSGENDLAVERERQKTKMLEEEAQASLASSQLQNLVEFHAGPDATPEKKASVARMLADSGASAKSLVASGMARTVVREALSSTDGNQAPPQYYVQPGQEYSPPETMGDVIPGVERVNSAREIGKGVYEVNVTDSQTGMPVSMTLGKDAESRKKASVEKAQKATEIKVGDELRTFEVVTGIKFKRPQSGAVSINTVQSAPAKAQELVQIAVDSIWPKKEYNSPQGRFSTLDDGYMLTGESRMGQDALALELMLNTVGKVDPETADDMREEMVSRLSSLTGGQLNLSKVSPLDLVNNPVYGHLQERFPTQMRALLGYANPALAKKIQDGGDVIAPEVSYGAQRKDTASKRQNTNNAVRQITNLPALYIAKQSAGPDAEGRAARMRYAQLMLDVAQNDQAMDALSELQRNPESFAPGRSLAEKRAALMDASIQMDKVPVFLADWESIGRSVDELEGVNYEENNGVYGWRVYINGKPKFYKDNTAESSQ